MVARRGSDRKKDRILDWCNSISNAEGMIWGGIDPGLGGALAFISENGIYDVLEVPLLSIKKNGKNKSEYNIEQMAIATRAMVMKRVLICQELTHAMPGNGNVSMYSFGRGHGLWEGIITALEIPLIFSLPQQWKKIYPSLSPNRKATDAKDRQKMKSEAKKEALNIARRLFPLVASKISRVSDDGKAEALLIANYCKMLSEGQIVKKQ
jgi:crossover junction endodeoxyribonuclease RuvC